MDLTLWIVPIAYFRILWYTVLSSTLVVYLQLTTRHSLIMFCLFWGVIIIMCKYFAPLDVCLRAVEQLRMCTCMSLWASKLMSFCPLSLSLSHSLFSPPPPSPPLCVPSSSPIPRAVSRRDDATHARQPLPVRPRAGGGLGSSSSLPSWLPEQIDRYIDR